MKKMSNPEVSVHLIVHNGEKYIGKCLEALKAQTYPNIKFRVFDNASTDATLSIAKNIFADIEIIKFDKNYILGGGFNRSLYYTDSVYVVGLSVDIIMAPDFIERACGAMEKNKKMGVLQAKILRWDFENNKKTKIIDTTGMQIFKSRRIINRGHGEKDRGQYDKAEEIFCYEGAVPFFRAKALGEAKMEKFKPFYAHYSDPADRARYPYEYLDEDFIWYADEVDLGWRMRLLGWGSWYEPGALAWHDRQTTHKLSGSYKNFIKHRKTVPGFKRKLDFQNQRLAFIKNDFWVNMLLDIPWFLKRELFLFAYMLVWERESLGAYLNIIKMFGKMIAKRRVIMEKRVVSASNMRKWFK
ncbi:MAG: glycosyltransferase family 2 protein [Candidatus Spechtbacterales bacterium]